MQKQLSLNSIRRTYGFTCAAVGAFCSVNNVNRIAFADCFNGAFRYAGTAGKAGIGNFMGHNKSPC